MSANPKENDSCLGEILDKDTLTVSLILSQLSSETRDNFASGISNNNEKGANATPMVAASDGTKPDDLENIVRELTVNISNELLLGAVEVVQTTLQSAHGAADCTGTGTGTITEDVNDDKENDSPIELLARQVVALEQKYLLGGKKEDKRILEGHSSKEQALAKLLEQCPHLVGAVASALKIARPEERLQQRRLIQENTHPMTTTASNQQLTSITDKPEPKVADLAVQKLVALTSATTKVVDLTKVVCTKLKNGTYVILQDATVRVCADDLLGLLLMELIRFNSDNRKFELLIFDVRIWDDMKQSRRSQILNNFSKKMEALIEMANKGIGGSHIGSDVMPFEFTSFEKLIKDYINPKNNGNNNQMSLKDFCGAALAPGNWLTSNRMMGRAEAVRRFLEHHRLSNEPNDDLFKTIDDTLKNWTQTAAGKAAMKAAMERSTSHYYASKVDAYYHEILIKYQDSWMTRDLKLLLTST